jgi:quercetin dioxygenase-like cupin family protein
MTVYVGETDRRWQSVEVRGARMEKSPVFEGDYDVRSAYFRMPAGCSVPPHDHSKWVQVLVLAGRMQVEQAGRAGRVVHPGECYFVMAGETHVETALEDTLLLVTQGEDRPGMGRPATRGPDA